MESSGIGLWFYYFWQLASNTNTYVRQLTHARWRKKRNHAIFCGCIQQLPKGGPAKSEKNNTKPGAGRKKRIAAINYTQCIDGKFLWTVTRQRFCVFFISVFSGVSRFFDLSLSLSLLAIVAAILSHFDNRTAHASRHVSADSSVAIRFNLPLHKFPQKVTATFAFYPRLAGKIENFWTCFPRRLSILLSLSFFYWLHLARANLFHTFPLANIWPA